MLIVLAPDDAGIIEIAKSHSTDNPEIYGKAYIWGDDMPKLNQNENLFIVGHGNNTEIGNAKGDFFVNGIALILNLKPLFPPDYDGCIFIDACHSGDIPPGKFSLIEQVRSQAECLPIKHVVVYGRKGTVSGAVPAPGDSAWVSA